MPASRLAFSSTAVSGSHNATMRTPLMAERLETWFLPRPLRPITATRMSLLAPVTWPHECAESVTAPVAKADDLRNERRVNLFIEDLFSSGVVNVTFGNLGGILVAVVKIEAVAQGQAAACGDG